MILKVKEFKQTRGYCGPTSLKIVMGYYGLNCSERTLATLANSSRTEGTPPSNLVNTAKILGFASRFRTGCSVQDLEKQIKEKRPVIINWFPEYIGEGHYSVVTGFDKINIHYIDPFSGKKYRISKPSLLENWYDFEGDIPPENKSRYIRRGMITIRKRYISN